MIIGRDKYPRAAAFDEINDAVEALDGHRRVICLRAHRGTPPPGSIVYNFENVPLQIENPRERWAGHECWDFSAVSAAQYDATHVPVGYHPSMVRFERKPFEEQDIDVVFTGTMNDRREYVINTLRTFGLNVVVVPELIFGAERDTYLARAKVALNMLYYPEGTFPALRVAHLVANRVPLASEVCPEVWPFIAKCSYNDLIERALNMVTDRHFREASAEHMFDRFAARPMVLP